MNEAEAFTSTLEPQKPQVAPQPVAEKVVFEAVPQDASPVNDVKDTINSFMDKVTQAKLSGINYVEVSKEIFDHYMRGQDTKYFIYQDVRVYKYGEREAIEAQEARTIYG